MKVGTDGVLLGAWTNIKNGNTLDIGTGTGLIAIMLAQRNQNTIIDAIEIDSDAFKEAKINIDSCVWSNRIKCHNTAIQDFQPQKKYDTIISNPPFFIDSTKASLNNRNSARHTDNLSYEDLINSAVLHLKSDGIFSLILPITESKIFSDLAKKKKLFISKKCIVNPNPTKQAKRVLLEFSFTKKKITEEELTIETETRHHYTKEYISLTQDFYLKF